MYTIQLHALSPSLPITSKRLVDVFKHAQSSFRARYLLYRFPNVLDTGGLLSELLIYPICTRTVLEVVFKAIATTHPSLPSKQHFKLPRRLFRSLSPSNRVGSINTGVHTFVEYLFQLCPGPDPNSHDGYALVRAVQARNVPIIRLLLVHGADPQRRDNLAVILAIQSKDLTLVKLLVERDERMGSSGPGKRRKLEDRVAVTAAMLTVAVKKQATDIAEWLMQEKSCVPDLRTLMSLP